MHIEANYYEKKQDDGNDRLLRKYIYGARVDEPVCMIEVADSNAVYYYHFDGLGSVVALSDSDGNSYQSYEYSVYGQVAAEDPNHPNPYMFTGRRFDIETGLYYYRARYYNPHIGRFMQTDPVGYADGINWYLYCRNNPLVYTDPEGLMFIVEPEEPSEPNDCDWEALEKCFEDAKYEKSRCYNRARARRNRNLHACKVGLDNCFENYSWMPFPAREICEGSCYVAHGMLLP